MNPAFKPFAWTVAAVALSALTAHLVVRRTHPPEAAGTHPHHHDHPSRAAGEPFHDWLHEKLEITPEQDHRLAPLEQGYGRARAELLARSEEAGRLLSDALVAHPTDRDGIDRALAEILRIQGDLQRLTINHFLEMKEHLSPEQAERLVQWTRQSLLHEHRP